jgi:hypothetical protein
MRARIARPAAAAIALTCWAGIALQFAATQSHTHGIPLTLWTLARFFTIIGNLAVAVAMTLAAAGRRLSPFLVGGLTLAVLLVGVIYTLLLAGLHPLEGRALVANELLHKASPTEMLAYWLLLTPHGRLRWSAPFLWTLFPASYLIYVTVRGSIDGRFPYPFIDIGRIGLERALLNSVAIGVGFILAGYLLVWLDQRLGSRHARG